MKKLVCFIFAFIILFGIFTGCADNRSSVYFSDNEIITYRKIDPQKTQITVSRTGNIPVEMLCNAFEEQNDDIQIIYIDITGGDKRYTPIHDWAVHGDLPDIVISSGNFFNEDIIEEYFVNLSDNPVINNFESAALQRTATNSNVYMLPGPSDINAMMYNKTLFDKYGWEVPSTFDEFVALCDRIRTDTNGEVEPWNPNAKYDNELTMALEAMTYEQLLGGVDNRTWYNDIINGNGTFAGHMEPYVNVIQTLIDHDILLEEHFSYSATSRGKEFLAGKIAMINMNIFIPKSDEFEFGYMPFPTTKGELGYLCDQYSCFLGLPKKQHTEKENDAIRRFLEYFSSAEGQYAYINNSLKVSNVKGVSFSKTDELAPLQPAIDSGHMFGIMSFAGTAPEKNISMHNIAVNMVVHRKTGSECIAEIDDKRAEKIAVNTPEQPKQTVAVAAENFTILETSFLIADAYRAVTGADIGLIAHNEVYRGNLMRLYAGDLTADMIGVFKPRSFANDSSLVKVVMSGSEIISALNSPLGNEKTSDSIYAYSGLKCEIAPSNDIGFKYLSISLEDGTTLEADKQYTVAFWSGTVDEAYISQTPQIYEGSWDEHIISYLSDISTVAPANDGRIIIVWE